MPSFLEPLSLEPANAREVLREQGLTRDGGVRRTLGDRAFQIQFYTTNLQMRSQIGANLYPVLTPSPAVKGFRKFREDVILIAAYISVTFVTVAAAETECVAVAKMSPNLMNVLGDANTYLQCTLDNAAAGPAGSIIQRNVGFSPPTPFVPLIQQGEGLQLFGSDQTAASWYALATIVYVRFQDYLRLMPG